MPPRPSAAVWLPPLLAALGVVVAVDVGATAGVWTLAGLAFCGAAVRAFGFRGWGLSVRRRAVDAAALGLLAAGLAFVAGSGVLG